MFGNKGVKKKRPHLIHRASRSGLALMIVEGTIQICPSVEKYASSNRLPGRPGLHGSNQNIRYYCNASKLRSEDTKNGTFAAAHSFCSEPTGQVRLKSWEGQLEI